MSRRVWLGLLAVAITAGCGKDESKKTSSVTPTEIPATCPQSEQQDLDAVFAAAATKPPKPPRLPHVILTGLTPDRGVEGTRVLISGTDFKRKPGTVLFGNKPATVYSWAATGVVAIVPSGMVAGVTDVTVQVPPHWDSNALQFAVKPFIASVAPIEAAIGDTINLTGTGFGIAQGSNKLLVQCQAVTATTWTQTAISFTVPAYATPGTAAVAVEVNGVLSDVRNFTVRTTEPPPTSNYWVSMAAGRAQVASTAVWTGSDMIFYGGTSGGGSRYNPTLDAWTDVNTEGAPQSQTWGVSVWTGSEMVVWGGSIDSSGGRYDPATDSWAPVTTASAPSRRENATAVWTGTRMVVWGGWDSDSSVALNTGGRYDPVADAWESTTTVSAPTGVSRHTAVWTGSEMVVWGGNDASFTFYGNGGRYNEASNLWLPIAAQGAPAARANHTGIWTGSKMIVWGGINENGTLNTGGIYTPSSNSWAPVATANAPARENHTAVWTGQDMIIWGGQSGLDYSNTGARYNLASDTWTAIAASPLGARVFHTAVWTGTEMIVFGGFTPAGNILGDGARYRP